MKNVIKNWAILTVVTYLEWRIGLEVFIKETLGLAVTYDRLLYGSLLRNRILLGELVVVALGTVIALVAVLAALVINRYFQFSRAAPNRERLFIAFLMCTAVVSWGVWFFETQILGIT